LAVGSDSLLNDWEGAMLGTNRDSVLELAVGADLQRMPEQSTSEVEVYRLNARRPGRREVKFYFYRDTLALVEEKHPAGLDYFRQISSRYTQRFGPFTGTLTTAWRREGRVIMILRYDTNNGFNYLEMALSSLRDRIYQDRSGLHSKKEIKLDKELLRLQDSLRALEKRETKP
jgi:hypothetical protein